MWHRRRENVIIDLSQKYKKKTKKQMYVVCRQKHRRFHMYSVRFWRRANRRLSLNIYIYGIFFILFTFVVAHQTFIRYYIYQLRLYSRIKVKYQSQAKASNLLVVLVGRTIDFEKITIRNGNKFGLIKKCCITLSNGDKYSMDSSAEKVESELLKNTRLFSNRPSIDTSYKKKYTTDLKQIQNWK